MTQAIVPDSAKPYSISPIAHLSGREKAAIVVRLLLETGSIPALSQLPESTQTELVLQLAKMASVDQDTVEAVASEFADAIDRIGLSFPSGLDSALGMLEGAISESASSRVRTMSSDGFHGDPWELLSTTENERLVPILEQEAVEVCAIVLSKLPVPKAAELLSEIPGERARSITYAVSHTGSVAPHVVRGIGISLAEQLDYRPVRAFSDGPVSRVGAILNNAPASLRNDVLGGLETEDQEFAQEVRKAIFTFADIKDRVQASDVARLQRDVDPADLVTVIAAAEGDDRASADFILGNISNRMADNLRDEASEKKNIPTRDAETAMLRIVAVVRDLESKGELVLSHDEADTPM